MTDCITGVLDSQSIYCETREWVEQDSVRPSETKLPKSHGASRLGSSRVNNHRNIDGRRVNNYMSLNATGVEHLALLSIHRWAIVGDVSNIASSAFRIAKTLRSKQKVVFRVDPSLDEDDGSCKCSLNSITDEVEAVCLCIDPSPFGPAIIEQIIRMGVKNLYVQETHFWTLRKGSTLLVKCQEHGLAVHRGNMLLEFV